MTQYKYGYFYSLGKVKYRYVFYRYKEVLIPLWNIHGKISHFFPPEKNSSLAQNNMKFILYLHTMCVYLISKSDILWRQRCTHHPSKQTSCTSEGSRTWEWGCTWTWILHWTPLPSFSSCTNTRNVDDTNFTGKEIPFLKSIIIKFTAWYYFTFRKKQIKLFFFKLPIVLDNTS